MEVKKIGVVGAGTMGHGIALVAARSGYEVVMRDIKDEFVQRGMENIKKFFAKSIEKKKMTQEEVDAALSRIKGTTELNDMKDVDLVIEAAPENMDLKKELFRELDEICGDDTIFASNTSTLSISEMASVTKRPDKFIGMHWFNPPPLMRLIEVVVGEETSEETKNVIVELSKKFGKTPVIARDSPGFIVNRINQPWYNEGFSMIDEGVTTPEELDKAYRAFGFRMGPCEQRDLVGHDVGTVVSEILYRELGDSKFRPPLVVKRLLKAGRLGRKTGKGFYEYGK
ncbi:MAG: 3-hydroxyacyl-CoA dehydrogenase family protein [Candidatus Syntropharchaeia archaeon]